MQLINDAPGGKMCASQIVFYAERVFVCDAVRRAVEVYNSHIKGIFKRSQSIQAGEGGRERETEGMFF